MPTNITAQQFFHMNVLLHQIIQFDESADHHLATYFYSHRDQLGAHDRRLIAQIIFTVLRHLTQWRALWGEAITTRQMIGLALLKTKDMLVDAIESLLNPDEYQWLNNLSAHAMPESMVSLSGLPVWIINRLDTSKEDIIALGQSLMKSACLDVRVNTGKMKPKKALERLLLDGITVSATPYSPLGLRLMSFYPIQQHPLFLNGTLEIQDEGSQLVGLLMQAKRGETVVDFCAGAGGKTLQLGAQMASTGRLYAWDISKARLGKLTPRLVRSGLSHVTVQWIPNRQDDRIQRLANKVDRVLVDVPCSGLGTLRRHPDLRYRQSPTTLDQLTRQQATILQTAAQLVKPKGRLVYATCSFLPEENEAIVQHFLTMTPAFSLEKAQSVLANQHIGINCGDFLRLTPHQHATDGFFAAVLKKD